MYKQINHFIVEANSRLIGFFYDFMVISFFIYSFLGVEPSFIQLVLYITAVNLFSLLISPLTHIYRVILRYASIPSFIRLLIHATVVYLFLIAVCSFYSVKENNWIILNYFLFNLAIISPRIYIKILFAKTEKTIHNLELPKIILFGAGSRGVRIKRALFNNPFYEAVAFLDDNPKLHKKYVDGIEVYNPSNIDLKSFLQKRKIEAIMVTTPEIGKSRVDKLMKDNFDFKVQVLYTPKDIFNGSNFSVSSLKSVQFDELLGRNENTVDLNLHEEFYRNKNILVTGAAGSIGSMILDKLIKFKPNLLLAVDINETALFHLSEKYSSSINLKTRLINIAHHDEIEHCFNEFQFDYVFNAAAYKHVGMVESNILQGLRNNILGTHHLVDLSISNNVKKFVQISTDKAVRPTNIMGVSKQICEQIVTYKTSTTSTKSVITRFGNVIGSNGSVLPIFQKQINEGGPVKVTHPLIERFFMSISEAADLVIEACRIGTENSIVIFDMGKPHKIIDIAKKLIEFNGMKPYIDINIEIIGLRPGEKLFEELALDSEGIYKASSNAKIFFANKKEISNPTVKRIETLVDLLKKPICDRSEFEAINILTGIVPEYIPNNSPKVESVINKV